MTEDQKEFFRNVALYGDPDEYLVRLKKLQEAEMAKMDPSGAARLDRIEADISLILTQLGQLAVAFDRLYREGGQRLSGLEDEGSNRLEKIEKLLETINLRLAARP